MSQAVDSPSNVVVLWDLDGPLLIPNLEFALLRFKIAFRLVMLRYEHELGEMGIVYCELTDDQWDGIFERVRGKTDIDLFKEALVTAGIPLTHWNEWFMDFAYAEQDIYYSLYQQQYFDLTRGEISSDQVKQQIVGEAPQDAQALVLQLKLHGVTQVMATANSRSVAVIKLSPWEIYNAHLLFGMNLPGDWVKRRTRQRILEANIDSFSTDKIFIYIADTLNDFEAFQAARMSRPERRFFFLLIDRGGELEEVFMAIRARYGLDDCAAHVTSLYDTRSIREWTGIRFPERDNMEAALESELLRLRLFERLDWLATIGWAED
jgi:phosphoglycolate phosphatase-like HAD superfamily hydrolase